GKAVEKSSFSELDEKLTKLRQTAIAYLHAKHAAVAASSSGTAAAAAAVAVASLADTATLTAASDAEAKMAEKDAAAKTEADRFKNEIAQAANMFWALYAEQIGPKPEPLRTLDQIDLDRYAE